MIRRPPRSTLDRSRQRQMCIRDRYTTFLERLHYLIKKVHALECELVSVDGIHRLALRIDKIDHETVDDLRRFLGPAFISLAVVPEGMAFMQLELHFGNSGSDV